MGAATTRSLSAIWSSKVKVTSPMGVSPWTYTYISAPWYSLGPMITLAVSAEAASRVMIIIITRGILSEPIGVTVCCLCDWFIVYIMVWTAECF